MPKGVTKAYGISLLAKDLGLKQEEIMAIGDEENRFTDDPIRWSRA